MIGILSDAHGNRPAFDRAIHILASLGAGSFLFLGDALGYLPATGVLESIRSLGGNIRCIRGNHEELILQGRFEEGKDPVYQHRETRRMMSADDLAQIGNWPADLRLELKAGIVLCVHGSPADPTFEYVYPDTDLSGFRVAERFVFMGHTHRPFIRHENGKTFVNVGSCGLPRDTGSLGSAALLDELSGDIRLVRFDIRAETEQALESVPAVHRSVLSVFQRQSNSFEGELLER